MSARSKVTIQLPLLDPSRRRMLVLPLVVLTVGCALAYWSSNRREHQRQEVALTITSLMQDVCTGGDPELPMDPAARTLAPQLLDELKKACAAGSALNVQAATGDVENVGSAGGTATHHVLIRNGENVLIILRVHFDGSPQLRILGYAMPPTQEEKSEKTG